MFFVIPVLWLEKLKLPTSKIFEIICAHRRDVLKICVDQCWPHPGHGAWSHQAPEAFWQSKFQWLILAVSVLVAFLCFFICTTHHWFLAKIAGAMEQHPIGSVHNYKIL